MTNKEIKQTIEEEHEKKTSVPEQIETLLDYIGKAIRFNGVLPAVFLLYPKKPNEESRLLNAAKELSAIGNLFLFNGSDVIKIRRRE